MTQKISKTTSSKRKYSFHLRQTLVKLHRYSSLSIAVFLVCVGVSGAALAWKVEIDGFLNRNAYWNTSPGQPLPVDALLSRVQQQAPDARLGFLSLPRDQERSGLLQVSQWPGTDHQALSQVFVDRHSGAVLGGRDFNQPSILKASEFIPWLVSFHYSLNLGHTGMLFLGAVALLWLVNACFAWMLSLPMKRFSWSRWKPSWLISRKCWNLSTHRAVGLWLGPTFILLAVSAVNFNLHSQVFQPTLRLFTNLTPQPYEEPALLDSADTPSISLSEALIFAEGELSKQAITTEALGYVWYSAQHGYYLLSYYSGREKATDRPDIHLYIDHQGGLRHLRVHGEGTVGDSMIEWQFPLHSGQAFGTTGRLIVSISGVGLALMSLTGIIMWLRRQRWNRALRAQTGTVLET